MENVPPEEKKWNTVLESFPHDVYHTLQYMQHSSKDQVGSEVLGLLYNDELTKRKMFLPILINPLPVPLGGSASGFDISVPYGYGGPIADGKVDDETFTRFFQDLHLWAHQRSIVSGFLRWHPLFQIPDFTDNRNVIDCGVAVAVDLELFDGGIDDASRATHRSEIRWLIRNGYNVIWDDWSYYEKFQQLYSETMIRLESAESYQFDRTYFGNLRGAMEQMLHIGVVINGEGEVAAAALFTECAGIVQYSLSASDERFRRKSPTKLLLGGARLWSRRRGNKWLHLGGGLGAQKDALYKFKSGFSNCEKPFAISKIIFDDDDYKKLVRQAEEIAGDSGKDHNFPAYRSLLENTGN